MLASKGKISIRQAMILLFMMILSPIIRLFPQYCAEMAGKAGWLAPFAAVVPMTLLILVVNSFFKKYGGANLADVFSVILGRFIGRLLSVLYLIWLLLLLALYVRYYAERLLSSILPHTSIAFLIISILIFVFIAVRSGLAPIARVNELFFIVFLLIFLITFIFALPKIKLGNYMYVSYLDALPVMKASYVIIAIWGYFLFIFFFADRINNKEHIKRFGFQALLLIAAFSVMILLMTIGTLNPVITTRMSLPFFIALKNVTVVETVERLESLLIALWIISDFVTVTAFTYICVSLMKSIFSLTDTRPLTSPVILFSGIGSLFLAGNRFELEKFSNDVGLPVNVLVVFIIPVLVFIAGKLRRKI